jgi:Zn-dependent protease
MMLAAGIHFTPLMFAALLAWILSVCIHEFSHALVAYWGGDVSVREKGYLTLDPTRFIDPVFSLLVPAIILLLGGFPFPGAAVRIDHSRLKSPRWGSYVSAAGPASNLVLFLLLALPLHPALGLVDVDGGPQQTWVYFLGAVAMLNFIAALFNLIPVPPLDGFGMIEHTLDPQLQWKLRQPAVSFGAIFVLFFVVTRVDAFWVPFFFMLYWICRTLGLPADILVDGFNLVLHDQMPPGGIAEP